MRHMSFALTTDQVRRREKTVTRRCGWQHAKVGDVVQPIVKGQGLKKGEHVKRIGGPIRFVAVSREPLNRLETASNHPDAECRREGFPGLSPIEFLAMFCAANGCRESVMVTRIEFEYVDQ